MENRFEFFTSYITSIYKNIQKIKNKVMETFGLKSIHVMCLFYLHHYDNVTNGMLVKLTKEDKAAVSRALSKLKEIEFVYYDDDKYKNNIVLLDKGKEVAKYIDSVSSKIVSLAASDRTEEERTIFYSMLKTISEYLEDYVELEK